MRHPTWVSDVESLSRWGDGAVYVVCVV